MNPLDLSFDEKVKLVINSNHIPRGEGVNFEYFLEVELNKVLQRTGNKFTNKVRSEGIDREVQAAFMCRIKEGRYLFSYEQPTVKDLGNGTFQLICGEHRLQAHKLSGRKTIFVAVVSFDNLEDELIFQSNENDEDDEYVKAPRTQMDVILTLANMVEKGIIDIDDDRAINARLNRLNQKTNEFPTLRENLRAKYGIITPVKSYDDTTRRIWCDEYKTGIEFSSRSNIVPLNGVAYISKTFKGGAGSGGVRDLDYDPRCFFDNCYLLQSGTIEKVVNICSVNNATSDKIPKIREYKKTKMMQDMLGKCIQIVDDYRAGKYNPVEDVEFNFLPQIESDNQDNFS